MQNVSYVLVRGGLGNQMFQVAFGIALASKLGTKPAFINLSGRARVARQWELSCFGIQPTVASPIVQLRLLSMVWTTQKLHRLGLPSWPSALVERQGLSAPLELSRTPPHVVAGYWQKPAYFNDQDAEIRQTFLFPKLPAGAAPQVNAARPVAAIHVRRGDYASDPVARSHHLVCDASWYRRAWERLRQDVGDCQGLVFSDDPEWAREHLALGGDIQYVTGSPGRPAWVDLARMSQCQHFVISNSTYSWWAAYLSASPHKKVIAPRYWFRGVETATLQICPHSWILL